MTPPPLLLCISGHISQYPCKRPTNITTRGLGRREQPVRHRLPARSVGGLGEGPSDRKSDSCLSAYDPIGSSVYPRYCHKRSSVLMEFSNLPRCPPTPKTSGWLYPAARDLGPPNGRDSSGCQPVSKD